MNFASPEFLLLLAVCVTAGRFVRTAVARKMLLLMASLYFFAWLDVRFLPLLLGYVLTGWLAMQGMTRCPSARARKGICALAVLLFLATLGIFKYANFFVNTVNATGSFHFRCHSWVFPLGISFYTFQCISFSVDVCKGVAQPCGLLDFALLVCYFPKLTAGPIVRMTDIGPQLQNPVIAAREELYYGLRQFVFGLFEKVLLADRLALFVDRVFESPKIFSGLTLWLAVLCYTVQIYCDFSGYSNMAVGCSRMLGVRLPENFDWPYLSRNITEFWRRWHISLSFWLRDYLYIPLGGNRHGSIRGYLNQCITMILGGLWHGANWTFVAWGAWHGLMLVIHKLWRGKAKRPPSTGVYRFLGTLLTLFVVMLGWVVFRADSIADAGNILHGMFFWKTGVLWCNPFVIGTMAVVFLWQLLKALAWDGFMELPYDSTYSYTVLFTMVWLVILFRPVAFTPFVYGGF